MRTWKTTDRIVFCGKCHGKLVNPMIGANITGQLNLACPCGGKAVIKNPDTKKEDV